MKRRSAIWIARLLRGIDQFATISGLLNQPLQAQTLISIARGRTGASDFGDWSFREPLEVLLWAYREEADLTAFGRIAVRWDMLRYLCNLLRLHQEEEADPGILQEKIEQPIFILGLPRSGTTFLHNLLARDPDNLVPRCWQTIYPYPIGERTSGELDRRRRLVSRQFTLFAKIAPELANLHPLGADLAQECIEITGQVLRSLRFDTTHYVPSYARWLDGTGHQEAYRFHKRFLQHLQHQSGPGRCVLKSPDHIFALDALLENYPDARFIFVHRNPVEVLSSVARLTEILRRPFTRHVNRLLIGQQVSDRWAHGANLLIEASENLRSSRGRTLDLHYRTLVRDPLGSVAAIYDRFGLNLKADTVTRMRRFVSAHPNGGYGKNAYHLEDYGLDSEIERRRYRDYMSYFRIGSAGVTDNVAPQRARTRMAKEGARCFKQWLS